MSGVDGANKQTVNGQNQTARASEGLRKSIWTELLTGRSIALSSAILLLRSITPRQPSEVTT